MPNQQTEYLTEREERRVYSRAVNIGSFDFLRDIPQIHYLWQLYYTSPAEVCNSKTFKEWLINLTPEEYESNADRYLDETGFGKD